MIENVTMSLPPFSRQRLISRIKKRTAIPLVEIRRVGDRKKREIDQSGQKTSIAIMRPAKRTEKKRQGRRDGGARGMAEMFSETAKSKRTNGRAIVSVPASLSRGFTSPRLRFHLGESCQATKDLSCERDSPLPLFFRTSLFSLPSVDSPRLSVRFSADGRIVGQSIPFILSDGASGCPRNARKTLLFRQTLSIFEADI